MRYIVSIYRKLFNDAVSACDEVERNRVHVARFTPEIHKNGREKEGDVGR